MSPSQIWQIVIFFSICSAFEILPFRRVLKLRDFAPSSIFLLPATEVLAFCLSVLCSMGGTLGLKRISFFRETAEVMASSPYSTLFGGFPGRFFSCIVTLEVIRNFMMFYNIN